MNIARPELLLSIAIPTKNRQYYLLNLLQCLALSERQDFEVVVRDNSDEDSLRAQVEALDDPRIHYEYVPGWISVVDNCEAALSGCRGDYICMLGDDDGLMLEESLSVLEQARKDGIDAVMSDKLLYTWPGVGRGTLADTSGLLRLQAVVGGRGRSNVSRNLDRAIRRAGALGLEGLPSVYHAFISSRALVSLRAMTGTCFPGASPDMANAVGVAPFLKGTRYHSRPLVISGHSKTSAGGKGATKQHHGPISEQLHLPADTEARWFSAIPRFWSGPTIYAQTLFDAVSLTGQRAPGATGLACLYAACLIYHWPYRAEVKAAIRSSGVFPAVLIPLMVGYAGVILMQRARQLVRTLGLKYVKGRAAISAPDMGTAIMALRLRLGDAGMPASER